MNRTKLLIFFAIVLLTPLFIIKAATTPKVLTLDAEFKNNKLNVSGTSEDGVLAVAIFVYDEKEQNLLATQTTSVTDDNKYNDIIEIESGNYVIKAVNYDGGEYVVKKLTSSKTNTNTKTTNPKTYDSILKYSILFIISVSGIIVVALRLRKQKQIKAD